MLLAALVLGGCGVLPEQPAVIAPETARAAVEKATGLALSAEEAPPGGSALSALQASFSGGEGDTTVTVLVFFSADAASQPLRSRTEGSEQARIRREGDGTVSIQRLNVTVLYRRDASLRDQSAAIASALDDASSSSR